MNSIKNELRKEPNMKLNGMNYSKNTRKSIPRKPRRSFVVSIKNYLMAGKKLFHVTLPLMQMLPLVNYPRMS
jgi:hypothetical protein